MTPTQRKLLDHLRDRPLSMIARDSRWADLNALSRERLVSITPVTREHALVEITEAGRAALREGVADA